MAVRVGIVGVGSISRGHLAALKGDPEAEVVAICDVVEERARAAAAGVGPECQVFTEYRTMLDRVAMDCLFLLIPPFARNDQEFVAAERGIHLFVEKPVALEMERARQVQAATERAGIITATGHQMRYHEGTDRAMDVLRGRDIGMAYGAYLGRWISSPPQKAAWFNLRAKSGGQVVAQLCHSMDLARYVLGEPKRLWARHARRLLHGIDNFDIPDVSAGTVEFESGVIGHFFCSFALPVPHRVGFFVAVARDTLVEVSFTGATITGDDGPVEYRAERPAQAHSDAAFIRAVATGDPHLVRSPYGDAVKTLDFTLAFEHSADTGEVVEFADGRSRLVS
jgi:myo-inositol 2-dehydrogenase / D-chiro-inositol 1-dehydrogenase